MSRSFTLENCIGRGGQADVYEAWMVQPSGIEQQVAVKVLRTSGSPSPDLVKRFRDEARLLGRLHHPSVLQVIDLISVDGRPAIVTEYVRGPSLRAAYKISQPSSRAALEAMVEVADALAACHEATDRDGRPYGLIHRDVKPGNIIVGPRGHTKLIDLGVATFRADFREASSAMNDHVRGTLSYMPPEQLAGEPPAAAWDVFALGVSLLEVLTGQALHDRPRRSGAGIWRDYIDTKLAVPELHPSVVPLLRACLSETSVRRPSSLDLSQHLDRAAQAAIGTDLRHWASMIPWHPTSYEAPLSDRDLTAVDSEGPLTAYVTS
ncbi:MAG: serine/threonine protein kinase [Proteobacteria bacterium]|nr:serine/threonine protein kinase [Pseudomonadota bacterium]